MASQGGPNESRAAPLGAALSSMIVAWIVASGRNRGRPAMRRGALDTLYCGENNDFIAECERADSILWIEISAYAGPYRS